MDDYRELMTIARSRDWIGITEWGQEHGVSGTCPGRIREWWHPPRSGIVDHLFGDIRAVWEMAEARHPGLLSEDWLQRRTIGHPQT